MIGATEAMGKTLLGVTNQMDPEQLKDIEEVCFITLCFGYFANNFLTLMI